MTRAGPTEQPVDPGAWDELVDMTMPVFDLPALDDPIWWPLPTLPVDLLPRLPRLILPASLRLPGGTA